MKLALDRNATVAILLSISCTGLKKTTLLVQVTDPSGAPITGAHVVVQANSMKVKPMEISMRATGVRGEYASEVEAGVYDYFVSAVCYAPRAGQILLHSSDGQKVVVRMNLQDDADAAAVSGCSREGGTGALVPQLGGPVLPRQIAPLREPSSPDQR
jgi:hypothetical protein